MSDYSDERYDPKLARCGILSLSFDGLELTLKGSKKKTYKYKAASGKAVNGEFSYTAERQKVKNEGPIPAGSYWTQPDELDDNWVNCLLSDDFCASWGRYRITIHPYKATDTYERGGFFIHGGSVRGSAGCIDLTDGMTAFVERLRKEVVATKYLFGNCHIPLTVKYRAGK